MALLAGAAGWLNLAPASAQQSTQVEFTTEQLAFFEKKIRPILVERCYSCHSSEAKTLQGSLRLDTLAGVRRGGDLGLSINQNDLKQSPLLQAIRYEDDDLQMPPKGKLKPQQLSLLETWVLQGAPMPIGGQQLVNSEIDWEQVRQFWSFRPLTQTAPPADATDAWAERPLDAFIAARLREKALRPSPPADRRTLMRRLYFDLLGAPPSRADVERFVADKNPTAWPRLVESALASPRFGERWGRFWLDNARYTDTTSSWLEIEGSPYVYRDWVIRALNEDMAYDNFVRYQLAADAIEDKRPVDNAALGFLGLSPTYWKELRLDPVVIEEVVATEWEERIDAVGRTFLGLTIACARCHDHKTDPITSHDYYALAGVFANTRLADAPIIDAALARSARLARQEVAAAEVKIKNLRGKKPPPKDLAAQLQALQNEIKTARQTPHFTTPVASAVADAALHVEPDGPDKTKLTYKDEMQDVPLQIRGNPATKGDPVARQFLQLFRDEAQPFKHGSGRSDLAEAIVGNSQGLAARVMVNRIWHHHFGVGLVDTPSNLGQQGSPPTHPALLNYLAAQLIEHGWSLKWLHREILLSATYRQSSADSAAQRAIDPGNRLLWRMNRRRLEIEVWRDAMLTATGELDSRIGGPPTLLTDANNRRRTIYGLINRRDVDTMLQLHDFPEPTAHSPQRRPTMSPLQQLFVLNSSFMQARASAFAARIATAAPEDDVPLRAAFAFQRLYQRPAEQWEVAAIEELLTAFAGDGERAAWERCAQVLLGSNEFLFID